MRHSSLLKRGLFYALFFLSFHSVFAQNSKSFKLFVLDESGLKISDAYVQDANNGRFVGVVNNGIFDFTTSKLPSSLTLSHVSYESQTITITDSSEKQLQFFLKKKNIILPTVGVSAKIQEVNPLKQENIKDYLLTKQGILLLLSSGQKNKLKLITENGDKTTYLSIPNGAEGLHKDCRGLVHLIFEDSTKRVEHFLGELMLSETYSRKDFNSLILPCEIADGDLIIRLIQEEENQANTIFISTDSPPKFRILRQMFDLKMRRRIDEEEALVKGASSVETNSVMTLAEARRRQRNYDFFNFIIRKDLYTPIFRRQEQLVLFDHYNDSLITYNLNGRKLNSHYISHHLSDDFRPQMIHDETTDRIHLLMRHKRVYHLYEFDFDSNKIIHPIKISKSFPKRLKVKDGRVYYLSRDLTDEFKNYRLYSEPLIE